MYRITYQLYNRSINPLIHLMCDMTNFEYHYRAAHDSGKQKTPQHLGIPLVMIVAFFGRPSEV